MCLCLAEAESGNATRRMRKLLGPQGQHGSGNSNGNGNGDGSGLEIGNSKQNGSNIHGKPNPHGPRDPRVGGYKTDRVALLLNKASSMAATLDLETYAYESKNGTQLINVTSTMLTQGQETIVRLSFPYFTSIYYDPTLDVGVDATTAGYTSTELPTTPTNVKNSAASFRRSILASSAALLLVAMLL